MPGLVVRKNNGDLLWYPLFERDGHITFFPPEDVETGIKVGDDWKFAKYLPGYWEPGHTVSYRRRIGGGSGLVVLEDDGDLKYYPFKNETFFVEGTGRRVGRGFLPEWEYFVAEWTDNGTSDLLVRDDEGRLRLYPWNGREFEDLGRSKFVGEGFFKKDFPDLLVGYWEGKRFPDLVARKENGELYLYLFNGVTFKDQGKPRRIGRGFGDSYTHFFVEEWTGNGTPDLIVRKRNNELILYKYGKLDPERQYNVFAEPPYPVVGRGFKNDWIYLVGYWREVGRPDLIIRDDNNNLRFYPFENDAFVDLEDEFKKIGKGWKFSHLWDFYPEN